MTRKGTSADARRCAGDAALAAQIVATFVSPNTQDACVLRVLTGRFGSRLNIAARKVGQGDKALLDMEACGPESIAMVEQAVAANFLQSGIPNQFPDAHESEWSNVKLTSADVCLFFSEGDQFFSEGDQSETESSLEGTLSPSPPCEAKGSKESQLSQDFVIQIRKAGARSDERSETFPFA